MLKTLIAALIAAALIPESTIINSVTDIDPLLKPSFEIEELIKAKPEKNPFLIAPVIDAKEALAVDLTSNTILYAKNIYEQVPIASLTKLMTTLIVIEEEELNKTYTVSSKDTEVEGTKIWLVAGEKITIENLLYAALIHSGNDAAMALARAHSGEIKKFVKLMNEKAKLMGLKNTHFSNPVGLDEEGAGSSAYDLYLLAKEAYKHEFIQNAVKLSEKEISSVNGKIVHKLENTNKLLNSFLKIDGLKTGNTDEAKQCLILVAENEKGNKIMTIILGSGDRFTESKILIDWVFRSYKFPYAG